MIDAAALEILLNDRRIGTLALLDGDRSIFTFDEAYLADEERPTLSLAYRDQYGAIINAPRAYQTQIEPFFSNLLPEGALRDYLARRAGIREVIEFWLSPDGKVSRPALMNQFVQSLIWFHEACREPIPMIATTKFMAALDALACGGKAKGIKALITARFRVAESDPIRADGPSFSKVIDDLYSQGRSRLIHGSSDRIGHDWHQEHGLAESLARLALIACLHWAADHENLDDPKAMAK
jgi:HipA-like protein